MTRVVEKVHFNPLSALFKRVPQEKSKTTTLSQPVSPTKTHYQNYRLVTLADMKSTYQATVGVAGLLEGLTGLFVGLDVATADAKTALITAVIGNLVVAGVLGILGRSSYKQYKNAYTSWEQTGAYSMPLGEILDGQTLRNGTHSGGRRSL